MRFKDIKELTDIINSELETDFSPSFQRKRKQLKDGKRAATLSKLFKNVHNKEGWAINEGGGTELQYRIGLQPNHKPPTIIYGLGFNAQYTPHNNDKKPEEYIRPFCKAFVQHYESVKEKMPDFGLDLKDKDHIININRGEYKHFQKQKKIDKSGDIFELKDEDFQDILQDLKGPMFEVYQLVMQKAFENMDAEEKNMQRLVEIKDLFDLKSQVIFQGPPGTGKTHFAKEVAELMTTQKEPGKNWMIVQFHPSYDYTDFVRGIATEVRDGQVHYEVQNRVLAEMAEKANADRENNYVLIIDEINRANLPAVFGELIYALEYRGEVVHSMYAKDGDTRIVLPENLFIIGTMNTADRSIGQMDYALRRRFSFHEMLPDEDVLSENASSRKLFNEVAMIFTNHTSPDFQKNDVQIGHSYFMVSQDDDGTQLQQRLDYEIKPILYEYLKDGVLKESAKTDIDNLNT